MQIPPYGLTQRRHPQLRLPTEPRRTCWQMICRTLLVVTWQELFTHANSDCPTRKECRCHHYMWDKVHQNGRRPVRRVVKHACKISHPYLFPPLTNP